MNPNEIMKIFEETAYVRMGGSAEELRAAEYLQAKCAEFGCEAIIESFEVPMATIQEVRIRNYAESDQIWRQLHG